MAGKAKALNPNAVPTANTKVVDELHPDQEGVEYADLTEDNVTTTVDAAPAADVTVPATDETDEDQIPEELKGKTPAQLARMYREAQGLIGRQGSELGELRRLADTAIRANLTRQANPPAETPAPAAPKAPTDVDFFADPQKAIADAIAAHPALQELKGAAQQAAAREVVRQQREASAEFVSKHPDADKILADPAFREWVGKSKVRMALLHRAHKMYDVEAGNEVFSTWKEIKGVKAPATGGATAAAAASAAARKAASVPSSGNAAPKEGTGKKIFRRAEVLRMMEEDPARYESMADEIQAAYTEGRVR